MRSCRTAGDKGCVLLRMEINHKGITYDELSSSYKERTIIDVRNRNEIEACGQIPGSHCIPGTAETPQPCHTDMIDETNLSLTAMIYRGSFSEWEEKGGEVVKPGQPYEYNFDDSSDEEESFSGPAAENPSNLISDTSPPAPDASLQARNDYNKSL
ncbi:uncharacterized protein LOC123520074 isoform X2 [Portunus trituberculatus]|uniref:uncharacterized protein LOC123520074 isoform X2 n=1 Tax=Portunus trituberculatus TaxID=210409 RepID=UPI001E1CD24F|nr:uncharacterized protein LOC123520074 isoform X2 [Portunus trituberculatus]